MICTRCSGSMLYPSSADCSSSLTSSLIRGVCNAHILRASQIGAQHGTGSGSLFQGRVACLPQAVLEDAVSQ